MLNLNFRKWVEDSSNIDPTKNDPTLMAAASQAKNAAQSALRNKKSPLQAMQKSILNSDVPMNKLGKVLPKDVDQTDA